MIATYEIHPAIGIAGWVEPPQPGGGLLHRPGAGRFAAGQVSRSRRRPQASGRPLPPLCCRRDEHHRLVAAPELTLPTCAASPGPCTWRIARGGPPPVRDQARVSEPGNTRDEDDRDLIIDPGPRSVGSPGERQFFDTGRFRTTVVPLGEIAMEPSGRLLVLGGYGLAGSDPVGPPLRFGVGHFADNDDWYDDISDGSVSVTASCRRHNCAARRHGSSSVRPISRRNHQPHHALRLAFRSGPSSAAS